MKTRTRQSQPQQEEQTYDDFSERLDLDALSEEELEDLLFQETESQKGIFNLPTMAGLSMIVVGIAYLFQKLGVLGGLDLSVWGAMLPWLGGILIILLGFGVLSWRPKKKKQRVVQQARSAKTVAAPAEKAAEKTAAPRTRDRARTRKQLRRSRDKKIAGVCGGIGEYLNIDPTLVRIAFVIGTIATGGPFLVMYLLLWAIMAKPEPLSAEDRITIIRDS